MLKVRNDEPQYTFLRDDNSKDFNCYGNPIELTAKDSELRDQSLRINDETEVGSNPNRYKQHGFFFNADNCIGCHACESACSEKNDNPAHIAFRSVGFVEGGTYPNYQRINISMACNHCDDPVCLKGCPTRAYTKFAEYGAVLQDPDICFGCGYCTWVCPYNAPQLDPVKGEVSKCNMCVDRLEVGLKPSCVSACLGNALDFGVVENIPENSQQAKTDIPGFPSPTITQPNIRFQQTRSTHREMTRTDSVPLKYHRDDEVDKFKPTVDEKVGVDRQWNLNKLLTTHENAHIIFTLAIQASVGSYLILILGPIIVHDSSGMLAYTDILLPLLTVIVGVCSFGLFKLNMHLGKPHRFYRGFYNLKHSPVSREIAGVSAFYTGLLGYAVFSLFDNELCRLLANGFAGLGVISGPIGLYYMYKLYRIKARPFWDHWQTGTAFFGAMLELGALMILVLTVSLLPLQSVATQFLIKTLAGVIAIGLCIEGLGHLFHARAMKIAENEAAASYYLQTTQYGWPFVTRNVLISLNLTCALAFCLFGLESGWSLGLFSLWVFSMLVSAIISRALFFVLVIPTTMPGAFFWKNDGFVEHARKIGLADAPQHGMVYEQHHAFSWRELLQTIRDTKFKDMLIQVRSIF